MSNDTTIRQIYVKAASSEPNVALETAMLSAAEIVLAPNLDYERVTISISARPRGYAAAKAERQATRKALRRAEEERRLRVAQEQMARNLGLPEVASRDSVAYWPVRIPVGSDGGSTNVTSN